MWYLKPKSVGVDKLNTRWGEGIWLGIREESGEILIGTLEGVIKVRTVRRKAGDDLRWSKGLFNEFKGLPWQPVPGRESLEPPIKVTVPDEDRALLKPVEIQRRELIKLDFRINRSMVKDYGLTEGCRGCLNADSGNPIALNHSAHCRQRFFEIIGDKHPEQLTKVTEKWLKDNEGTSEHVKATPVTESKPTDAEMMEDDGLTEQAGSSGEPAIYADVDMSNVIYSISADINTADKVRKSLRILPTQNKSWNDDAKKMNKALTEEGFSRSIIEAYSPKRVTGMGELMGLLPGMSLDLTQLDVDGQPWNFNCPEKRREAERMIREKNALLLIGSLMCAAFSQIQNLLQ